MVHKSNQQINIEAQHFNNGLIFTSHPWPAMVRHQLPPNVPRSNLWIFLLDSKCNSKSHLKRGKPWKVRSDGVGVLWDLSWRVVKSIYILYLALWHLTVVVSTVHVLLMFGPVLAVTIMSAPNHIKPVLNLAIYLGGRPARKSAKVLPNTLPLGFSI